MQIDYSKYQDKIKFWKKIVEDSKNFTGTSPPSIFVGRFSYPKVFVGILSPPTHEESAEILDSPESWYANRSSIQDILNFRGRMIFSRFKTSSVKRPSGKLEDVTQEIAMVKRPTDIEIELKKNPKFQFSFGGVSSPIGNPAPIVSARVTENPYVEHKVDYVISDSDFKAIDAVDKLYKLQIPVSRIQKIFSAGLLGKPIQRKFVPTRWGITAVDDIIGKGLMRKVKDYQELDEIRLFRNEYLGNHYEILLIPMEYQYEIIELWNTEFQRPTMSADYEPHWGRKYYANQTHGAFYSGKLAVLEYLEKIQRQSGILIIREILQNKKWQMYFQEMLIILPRNQLIYHLKKLHLFLFLFLLHKV